MRPKQIPSVLLSFVALAGLAFSGCRMGFAGSAEEGCAQPEVAFPRVLSEDVGIQNLNVASGHGESLAVWLQPGDQGALEVWMQLLDQDGRSKLAPELVSPDDGFDSANPTSATFDDGFGVAWVDRRDGVQAIYLRLVEQGFVGPENRLTDPGDDGYDWMPTLAADDGDLVVAWHDAHEVYFQALDDSGARQGEMVQLTNDPYMREPVSVACGMGSVAIVWADERWDHDIFFARVNRAGKKEVLPVEVAPAAGNSFSPSLVFDGESFALAWVDDRLGLPRLFFARLDGDAQPVFGPKVVPVGRWPEHARMFWTGSDYGLIFLDQGRLLYVALDAEGEPRAPETALSGVDDQVLEYAAAWSGAGYQVTSVGQLFGADGGGNWSLGQPVLMGQTLTCGR